MIHDPRFEIPDLNDGLQIIIQIGTSECISQIFFFSIFFLFIFLWNGTKYQSIKGIVHFEIKIWYLSAYPKGIQDVGVFFSSVDPILMFLGQTVLVCQSYNGRYRSLSL